MAKKKSADSDVSPQQKLFDAMVATIPEVERRGKTMPYTSVNGNMFAFLSKDGDVALRLPEEKRLAFMKKYKATPCEQYGVVMKEYVVVPATLLKKTAQLKPHFQASYEYTLALKPKPTTRKKKSASKKSVKKKAARKKTATKPAKKTSATKKATKKEATKKKATKKKVVKRKVSKKKTAKRKSAKK